MHHFPFLFLIFLFICLVYPVLRDQNLYYTTLQRINIAKKKVLTNRLKQRNRRPSETSIKQDVRRPSLPEQHHESGIDPRTTLSEPIPSADNLQGSVSSVNLRNKIHKKKKNLDLIFSFFF